VSGVHETDNPFPGPQPYRAADRERFFGRDALVKKLANQLLARSSTTLYGPSGAGKSSLMQAGVIPRLKETHDFRVVRVDGWPPGEAPLSWLVRALFADLELGAAPADKIGLEDLDEALSLAERRSEQPILIYLDQLEQLLSAERAEAEAEALITAVERLARAPIQGLQIVLGLREDYLGRFRDRARDRREILAHGFRLGPLTVGEMVKSVCRAAAGGRPPQRWDEEQIRALMRDVRTPGQSATDEADVQAAYAQIVCRALFQSRAAQPAACHDVSLGSIRRSLLPRDSGEVSGDPPSESESEAEIILRRYLEATLKNLGSLASEAQRLLEDHLVTADGSRTLRTENELLRILPQDKLAPILKALEGAAILHAEAHQGSRYFEIGHDWLARKVYEERQNREREEERKRRAEEQEEALGRQRQEADKRLAQVWAQRRLFAFVALASVAVAAGAGALGLWALAQQKKAEEANRAARHALEKAQDAEKDAKDKAIEASDARLLAGFRELKNSGQIVWGTKLLAEVQRPESARGWTALASDALRSSSLFVTLRGHEKALTAAAWSPDGERVVTASTDGTARVYSATGEGQPVILAGHGKAITSAAFDPAGRRVLTTLEDGTARIWSTDGSGQPITLEGNGKLVRMGAWSPDGERVVTASSDNFARVWRSGGGGLVELPGHTGPLSVAAFLPGGRVLTASSDKTARIQNADGSGEAVVFKGHKAGVRFAVASPDGARIITVSDDKTARIWSASGRGKPVVLEGHEGGVLHAAWSPDGKLVATASADRTARVWKADGKGRPVILSGHSLAVTSVAFRLDGRYVVTASRDQTARIWPAEGGAPFELSGHASPVLSAEWSADGSRVLTAAAAEEGGRSLDRTARIWRPTQLEALHRERPAFFHSAFIGAGGDAVVSAYDDGAARLWRVDGRGDPVSFTPIGRGVWTASAALSRDGARVVLASFDKNARVVRADGTGDPVVLSGHTAAVRAAAFSPDGSRVATASDDRTALLHNADGKGEPLPLKGHTDSLTSVAWSLDGKRVVTTSLDHTACVWRADGSGAPVVLKAHGGGVYAAAWSPDGARIVTASEDGTAQVWSAERGEPEAALNHGAPVLRAVWSPDGRRIATSAQDGRLRLFSADGAGEPVVLEAPPALAIAFIDGGRSLLAVAEDNAPRAFTVDVEALKRGLLTVNADCLPWEMRATYLGEPADKAREVYSACEREHGRAPYLEEGKGQ